MSDLTVGAFVGAVVGWLTTHLLSLRAQRMALRLQALDRARLEVTAALRDYQRYLGGLSSSLMEIRSKVQMSEHGLAVDWRAVINRLDEARQAWSSRWGESLEEYEILFPTTRLVRGELMRRDQALTVFAVLVSTRLLKAISGVGGQDSVQRIASELAPADGYMDDQQVLVHDLMLHLQNAALKEVAGLTVPPRVPLDLSTARLATTPSGQIGIVGTPIPLPPSS